MFEAVLVIGPFSLMEVIHIELPDEGRKVVVLEKPRKDGVRKVRHSFDYE